MLQFDELWRWRGALFGSLVADALCLGVLASHIFSPWEMSDEWCRICWKILRFLEVFWNENHSSETTDSGSRELPEEVSFSESGCDEQFFSCLNLMNVDSQLSLCSWIFIKERNTLAFFCWHFWYLRLALWIWCEGHQAGWHLLVLSIWAVTKQFRYLQVHLHNPTWIFLPSYTGTRR